MGFYNCPDKSFYDPDGHYFNPKGFDEFGGYYDVDNKYVPGEGNKDLLNNQNEEGGDYENN